MRYDSPHQIIYDLDQAGFQELAPAAVDAEPLAETIEDDVSRICAIPLVLPRSLLDPVLGSIRLPERVMELAFSWELQRLNEIRQLSLVHKEFPSASHSRFSHSVGVASLVAQATRHLRDVFPGAISDQEELETIAAGLLHDIGHGPLGHVMESFFDRHGKFKLTTDEDVEEDVPVLSHEVFTRRRILENLADTLAAIGLRPDQVAARALGLATGDGNDFLSELIGGYGLDLDKLEYLLRDSYFLGIWRGTINADAILHALRTIPSSKISEVAKAQYPRFAVENSCHLSFEEATARTLIYSALQDRLVLYERVYHGPTNRAAQLMIVKALEDLEAAGLLDLDDLMTETDAGMWGLLLHRNNPPLVKSMALQVLYNRLHVERVRIRCGSGAAPNDVQQCERLRLLQQFGEIPNLENQMVRALSRNNPLPASGGALLIDIPDPVMKGEPILVVPDDPTGRPGEFAVAFEELGENFRALLRQDEGGRAVRLYAPPQWDVSVAQIRATLERLLKS